MRACTDLATRTATDFPREEGKEESKLPDRCASAHLGTCKASPVLILSAYSAAARSSRKRRLEAQCGAEGVPKRKDGGGTGARG